MTTLKNVKNTERVINATFNAVTLEALSLNEAIRFVTTSDIPECETIRAFFKFEKNANNAKRKEYANNVKDLLIWKSEAVYISVERDNNGLLHEVATEAGTIALKPSKDKNGNLKYNVERNYYNAIKAIMLASQYAKNIDELVNEYKQIQMDEKLTEKQKQSKIVDILKKIDKAKMHCTPYVHDKKIKIDAKTKRVRK